MTLDPKALEAAARKLSHWIGYDYDGLSDRDISDKFPDWAFNGIGHKNMQGGKPAVMRTVQDILTAYLAALPPVDVAGLVDEAREAVKRAASWDRCWPGNLNIEQLIEDLAFRLHANATALERVARRVEAAERELKEAKRWNAECDNARNVLIENVRVLNEHVEAANWLAAETKRALEEKRLFAKTVERERDEAQASAARMREALREIKTRAAECIGACQDVDVIGEIANAALASAPKGGE